MQTNIYTKFILLLSIYCFSFFKVSAEDVPTQVLSNAMKVAHAQGVNFEKFELFTITDGAKHTELAKETLLLPNTAAVSKLYDTYPKAISLNLKTADGKQYTLELMRSTPLAFNPDMGYIDANGRHKCGFEKGAHYQGAVAGVDKSLAAVSVFANGEVMILFATDEGNFVAGKLNDNTGRYILYNDHDFVSRPATAGCGVTDYGKEAVQQSGNKTTTPYGCNKVSIYWEADYQAYQVKLSNVTNTQNYLTGLFNEVQAMYRNEKVAVELKSIYIWTIADNYDSTNSNAALTDLKKRWNAVGDTFKGNLAMLLARDQKGNGGIAFVGVLCGKTSSYAYGDVDVYYNTIPAYSWDVEMVTHEHGHNMGSKHTHWCGWNTGPSGSCGAIDNCTTIENTGSCPTCPYYQYDDALPTSSWQGTVMSYCHLVARKTNLANGFGPLPNNTIRVGVAGSACLSSVISATLTPVPICKKDGAVILKYDTSLIGSSNFAPLPYRHVWSNGNTTQNATGITTPGNYSITITDSSGCEKQYSVTVLADTTPGCWKTGISTITDNIRYVSVYPNPAHNTISVKYFAPLKGITSLKITDIVGKTSITQDIPTVSGENNATINISSLSKGVYFIKLNATDATYNAVKLVIE